MAHDHSHEDRNSYYIEQLLTIGVCGALAGVTLMLWFTDRLSLLAPEFRNWVLLGGSALLVLVIIRSISVWVSVGNPQAVPVGHGHDHDHHHHHDHDHDHHHHDHGHHDPHHHDHDCDHHHHDHHHHDDHHHVQKEMDHGGVHAGPRVDGGGTLTLAPAAPAHDHGHDHEHGAAPWRFIVLLLPVVLYFLILQNPAWTQHDMLTPEPVTFMQKLANFVIIFRSILWEALPFIVLGAVIAGILEEMLPPRLVASLIPRNPVLAIFAGSLLGLIFPMCECGIIPVMRRLLRKGLPLSACIAYLLAGPVINVVVIMSTYAAFFKTGGWAMPGLRVGVSFLVAVGTALVVEWLHRRRGNSLLTPLTQPKANTDNNEIQPSKPFSQRLGNISETALHDFVDITVFLILGALLAAFVRMFLDPEQIGALSEQYSVLAILIMMGLAIVLCLCSEADAFVAYSFTTLKPAAKLSFLVLGPMMDIKLYLMYTRIFRPTLIFTIGTAVLIQVFMYSYLAHMVLDTYAPNLFDPKEQILQDEGRLREIRNQAVWLFGTASAPRNALWLTATTRLSSEHSAQSKPWNVSPLELQQAAESEARRAIYKDRRVSLEGQFMGAQQVQGGKYTRFQLVRYRRTCCAADAVPLKALIRVDQNTADKLNLPAMRGRWLQVTGKVEFFGDQQGQYITAVIVEPTQFEQPEDLIRIVKQPKDPYLN